MIITSISTVVALYLFILILQKSVFKKNFQQRNQIKEQILKQIYENRTGKKFDKRTRLEIFNHLREKNSNIQVTVNPNNYINKNKAIFPFSGISNSKTIFVMKMVIMHFIKVIDMDLTILMITGIKMK